MLHLLGGVPVPGVVFILAVLLSPQTADFTLFLEFFGLLLQSVLGGSFSERTKRTIVIEHMHIMYIQYTLIPKATLRT